MQFVHEKELGVEDDQVFLLKLQVSENVHYIFVQLVWPKHITLIILHNANLTSAVISLFLPVAIWIRLVVLRASDSIWTLTDMLCVVY